MHYTFLAMPKEGSEMLGNAESIAAVLIPDTHDLNALCNEASSPLVQPAVSTLAMFNASPDMHHIN